MFKQILNLIIILDPVFFFFFLHFIDVNLRFVCGEVFILFNKIKLCMFTMYEIFVVTSDYDLYLVVMQMCKLSKRARVCSVKVSSQRNIFLP